MEALLNRKEACLEISSMHALTIPTDIPIINFFCGMHSLLGIITLNLCNVLLFAAPPQIIRDFRPNTVIAEEQRIQFTCVAQGYPAPTVSWEHEGQMVVNGDNPHFNVNSTNNRNDGFIVTVTSFLTVSLADDSVSGEVRCIALPPPPDMVGGMALNSDDTSTQLSILGKLF